MYAFLYNFLTLYLFWYFVTVMWELDKGLDSKLYAHNEDNKFNGVKGE